ncbi:hypothetical protein AMJ82_03730 [candidate division TA06 bacterium SM23_40]|uniref:Mechanosensitive ion channel MscS domain-containing protein n=1 Tax=candidate division TA06 bacterium SM23_40 TaxID=1703774 RepID=A0A0S8GAP0_UNCT6|nr:MAG: hypothetical protein AMJ82_03730 [candidate division TA06 bacterium SM23_40]
MSTEMQRILLIVVVAAGAHVSVLAMRSIAARLLGPRAVARAKVQTIVGFVVSTAVFVIYFAALGFTLRELGVSLTAYFAGASIIGLAVSFGSQGVIQDVISGLTMVLTDVIDIGDMVEVGGQVGIVEHVGIRFTVLISVTGSRVYLPNRSLGTVINYPDGFVRAFLDARLPRDTRAGEEAHLALIAVARAVHQQFGAIMPLAPTVLEPRQAGDGYSFVRVKFRLWPGQGAILDSCVKPAVVSVLRALDPEYADWMVVVHYRAEPSEADSEPLPQPAPVRLRMAAGKARRDRRMRNP